MKKTFIKILFLSALIGGLAECRKGEDDPLISFRSRKARVAGEWKLTSGSVTGLSTSHGTNPVTTSYTENYTESTYSYFSNSGSQSGTHSYDIEFKKDGTYTSTQKMSTTITGTVVNNITITTSGVWNFTGRVGDYKEKEQIVLKETSRSEIDQTGNQITTTSNTIGGRDFGGEHMMSWTLRELRNKKLVIYSKIIESDATSFGSSEMEMTFEQD